MDCLGGDEMASYAAGGYGSGYVACKDSLFIELHPPFLKFPGYFL